MKISGDFSSSMHSTCRIGMGRNTKHIDATGGDASILSIGNGARRGTDLTGCKFCSRITCRDISVR